ncbi:MAG: RNase adapter RapZ [Gammaproteobacteria bacterium]|nr:RNase adapter RapZ [Gammaproteobacteria bacterium]
MSMVIISGLSGSGKSVALHALEDLGFYCIDNFPVGMLTSLANEIHEQHLGRINHIATCIDIRNRADQLARFPEILGELRESGLAVRILFLQADDATLLKRFSETRRKHPLSDTSTPLTDAITRERTQLEPIIDNTDLFIDTSRTSVHQLRKLVMDSVGRTDASGFSLLLRSFGYKHGIPADADFVFDARCLPNPFWEPDLRNQTGLDKDVVSYLEQQGLVNDYYEHLQEFLARWIPQFKADNRSYLSIAIGCTGGQHRSVYLVDRLSKQIDSVYGDIVTRHREME